MIQIDMQFRLGEQWDRGHSSRFRSSCWPAWWWRCLDSYNYCIRSCSDWSLASWLREYESILWSQLTGGVILEPAVVTVVFWSKDCYWGTKRQLAASWFPSWRKCPLLAGHRKGCHSFGRPALCVFVILIPGSLAENHTPALLMILKPPNSSC